MAKEFHGVYRDERSKRKSFALIKVRGNAVCLGHTETSREAALLYDAAAVFVHGDSGRRNLPYHPLPSLFDRVKFRLKWARDHPVPKRASPAAPQPVAQIDRNSPDGPSCTNSGFRERLTSEVVADSSPAADHERGWYERIQTAKTNALVRARLDPEQLRILKAELSSQREREELVERCLTRGDQ